jgi:hypothetical protein
MITQMSQSKNIKIKKNKQKTQVYLMDYATVPSERQEKLEKK